MIKTPRSAALAALLVLLLALAGCRKAAPSASTMKLQGTTLHYTPALGGVAPQGKERFCLVVLVSKTGKQVDEQVASAGGSGTVSFSGTSNASVLRSTVRGPEGEVGERHVIHDTEGTVIKDQKEVLVALDNADAGSTVSAAVGVFDSSDPNYRFIKLVTPVSSVTK